MERVFVIGDIHGAHRALLQCLEMSKFDYQNDHLICLGDVADGWPDTKAAVDELLKIRNLQYILGNHDWWTLQWMQSGKIEEIWRKQGGQATIDAYADGVPPEHIRLFAEAPYYHQLDNRIFVHAGIDPLTPLHKQDWHTFLWDRTLATLTLDLYAQGIDGKISSFEEIYIGHTPIPFPHPIQALGVWLLDTGAGWSGVLSMMNVNTKETFISDPIPELYPGIEGRKKFR